MFHVQEKNVHRVFIISLILKGLSSLLEIIGGILFMFTGRLSIVLSLLIKGELIEDPTDFVANQIQHALPYFLSNTQLFGTFYLLSHGIIKMFLVVSLISGRLWAYPATIATLFLFIAYQIYRLSYNLSPVLILLTLFDFLIIYLTWHEYKVIRKLPRFSKQI